VSDLSFVGKPGSIQHLFIADDEEFCRKSREYGYGRC
jgi:hypothetical protein